MTDVMERTPVQDVVLDEPKVETPVKPSRKEPSVEVPKVRGPVRWFHWMIAVLVLIIGATALVVALDDSGTTNVLDTDGSFQAVETQRMERLAPAEIDFEAFLQDFRVEVERLGPAEIDFDAFLQDFLAEVGPAEIDFDGSFQAVETQRMLQLAPGS